MSVISISCSPSGQDIDKIIAAIKKIRGLHPDAVLYHAFTMDLNWAKGKGYPIQIQETFSELFPEQKVFVEDNKPQRLKLAQAVAEEKGIAYIIGDVKKGAATEALHYGQCLPVHSVKLIPLHAVEKKDDIEEIDEVS